MSSSGPRRKPPTARRSQRAPVDRFRHTDSYRARREWLRYEGTGQRDLYRELRERFLARHTAEEGWVLDVGSGPGRFLPWIGRSSVRRVALDVSREMLSFVPQAWKAAGDEGPMPHRVLGDATWPPLRPERWSEVALLGNTLGFAGPDADRLLAEVEKLVEPGGRLVIEIAPGPGERSRYFARLPPSALPRLFRAPMAAILPRCEREGFRPEPPRHETPRTFRRYSVDELHARLSANGWQLEETVAVAPALGPDNDRITAVRADAKAWARLEEFEEQVGRQSERWPTAAAVLVAARRPAIRNMIK